MKFIVKRDGKGYVTIKLSVRDARNLATLLNYSGLNEEFKRRRKEEFSSAEIVADMLYNALVDKDLEPFA